LRRDEIVLVVATVVSAVILLLSGRESWVGLAVAVAAFSALWLVSLALRDASIVDIAWGPGFVLVGWVYAAGVVDQLTLRGVLAVVLVSVWGLRLAIHIGVRNGGQGEDFRYAKWRQQAGSRFWWTSYFKVFLLQAILLWIVGSPLLLAQYGASARLSALGVIGVALWAVGFTFEVVADWQLLRFKKDASNQGRVMQSGLWRLSRHPNYFGEAVLWWGLGLLALSGGGVLALVGPALLTFLLLRISGVVMLDRALVERKPEYAAYVASTPSFIPWPRRRTGARQPPSVAA
jgi:steroid 5-alpha reductase family enzyme